jgi:short-subunit dehydrogenase
MAVNGADTTQPRAFAVVTGASAGLGEAFARELASRGYDLLLVARRGERLRALTEELQGTGRTVLYEVADLSTRDGVTSIWQRLDSEEVTPTLLVNNAGFGVNRPAIDVPEEQTAQMMRLNIEAVTVLAIEAARRMAKTRGGGIINVASTAAFQAVPYMAVYGATKSYVLTFSEALNEELRGTGVRVFAFCPGATRTEFQEAAGLKRLPPGPFVADPTECVRRCLDAFDSGRARYVDGVANAATLFAQRLLPRGAVIRISGWVTKPPPPSEA